MYIPIGPSKKQLYKIILLLLCLLFGFKSCAKAQVTIPTTAPLGGYLEFSPNEKYKTRNINAFGGYGKGYLIFTLFTERTTNQQQYQVGRGIDQISVVTDNYNYFTCEIGTTGFYLDNSYYDSLITAKCPINLGTLTNIRFGATQDTTRVAWLTIGLGDYITFVPDDNSAVVDAIQQLQTQMAQQQIINNSIKDNTDDIKNSINSDDVDNNQANSFFSDFSSNTPQGLVSLINKPLDFLNGLYNECSPITVYVPYFDFDLTLPCISSIHNGIFDTIIPIAKIIINGLICYRLVLGFINIINKLKDPNDSDIEVVDL